MLRLIRAWRLFPLLVEKQQATERTHELCFSVKSKRVLEQKQQASKSGYVNMSREDDDSC